jgi:peptide/nickel transport system ATP-binding protein
VVDLGTDPQPVARSWTAPPAPDRPSEATEILRVDSLSAWAFSRRRTQVLHDVDLALDSGGAVAVVGNSGAGKTTLARAIVGLHRQVRGRIGFDDGDLPPRAERRSREQRRRIQLVPQDPLGTLNPSRTVGATLHRPLRMHRRGRKEKLAGRTTELLEAVGLSGDFAGRYPHELSGGQRQRVAIARALAAEPDVLVCDEITSSLDNSTADEIMGLLSELRNDRGLALVVISHEMSLVARHTGSVVVLDDGHTVESGPTSEVLKAPSHPATAALSRA